MPHITLHTLRAAGTELIVDIASGRPVVLHWGPALGESPGDPADLRRALTASLPHAVLDDVRDPGVWRERGVGFFGHPALSGRRGRRDWSPLFAVEAVESTSSSVHVVSVDREAALRATTRFEMTDSGCVLMTLGVTNIGDDDYQLDELTTWLPLPDRAAEAIDFHGRWTKERQIQRRPIGFGTIANEIREGRSGHGHTIVQLAATEGAGFGAGEVWSVGLMWSGNSRHLVERGQSGRRSIGAGELLEPGELVLSAGETYIAPTVVATYSDVGINGISDRLHTWLRSRPAHVTTKGPRPLTLNVWEAVYFNHDLTKLTQLLEVAAQIGVERFVLDDGWFGARRDDHAGLGDWVVSRDAWPDGLAPLISRVKKKGMQFGLWFEGEMVNADSDLYRAHPDWILHVPGRLPLEGRHQHILDITHDGAFEHILGQVDAILSEYDIDYIKWDHNKVLVDPGHHGVAAVHEQTAAVYRLFDELRRRHPRLEIESCSSGGARIDLGMVHHADRFWTSDCNDALERQQIQRYTQIAIPPEMLGSHIGPTHSHTTGRTHSLSFRAVTALFGHAGLEWDLTETTADERERLADWARFYKEHRGLLHSGRVTVVDHSDPAALVHGVVAHDASEAIFAYVQVAASAGSVPDAARLPGLDHGAHYRVSLVEPAGPAGDQQLRPPGWVDGVVLSGAALGRVGLQPPLLWPEQAVLLHAVRV